MSFKAKDLSYDNTQPAFLRRLRGELAGDGSGRHERPIPRNKRLREDDEEDAPTYVLEETNQSLTKTEYEAMLSVDANVDNETLPPNAPEKDATLESSKTGDKVADASKVQRKRKVAKIIGEEQPEVDSNTKRQESIIETSAGTAANKTKKTKKKAKPVKLSFGDQDDA